MALAERDLRIGTIVDHQWRIVNPRSLEVKQRNPVRRGMIVRIDENSSADPHDPTVGAKTIWVKFKADEDPQRVHPEELTLYRRNAVRHASSGSPDRTALYGSRTVPTKADRVQLEDDMGLSPVVVPEGNDGVNLPPEE